MKEQTSEAEYNNDFLKVWFCEVMSERTPGVMQQGISIFANSIVIPN
jgi:hypothetical protein